MQAFRICYVGVIFQQVVYFSLGIFGLGEFRRYVDVPVGKLLVKRLDPFGNTCLTRIDFLSATDETDNCCPVFSDRATISRMPLPTTESLEP